ncbi:MAG: hypothetical protein JOZ75_07465 [Candidatus Dormibacteraeota bacterium]|nr:hypothetical protein [Candidatus Dormibacteraeota bacterium]
MIVLVTIHGIGFQQAPSSKVAQDGYADALHAALAQQLPKGMLGDDPDRPNGGAVYVESSWPAASNQTEPGLARLGTWQGNTVVIEGQPLVGDQAGVAHVALVYSRLQEQSEDTIALLDLGLLGAPAVSHYATVGSIIRMAFQDVRAMHAKPGPSTPSLSPRETKPEHTSVFSRLFHHPAASDPTPANAEPTSTFRQVQDDIAAYVVRNEHRERVRAFVRDAISRIMARPDVDGVIVNGHSNGCVMTFDFLAAMSPPQAPKVRAVVTSGCPLRKYVDFMDWGTDARSFGLVRAGSWTNFYDEADPVADPMQPDATWKRTDSDPGGPGLFVHYNPQTGERANVAVSDVKVDNVGAGVGGGLPAHNYWDNVHEFVAPLAGIITKATGDQVGLNGAAAVRPAAAGAPSN